MPKAPKKLDSPYANLPSVISTAQIAKLLGVSDLSSCLAEIEKMELKNVDIGRRTVSGSVSIDEASWSTTLRYRGETVEGECDCPASDGFEFCIHCAALCLHANKHVQQITVLDKGPDKSKVMAYLLTLDKQNLARSLLEFISDDAEQLDRYLIKAMLSRKEIDYAQLKSRITELTKIKEKLFSQRQVKHFFNRIERLLDEFSQIEEYSEPEKMLKLIEYTFQRLTKLLEELEDNSGQRDSCVEKLREIFLRLFLAMNGRDDTKLKRLLPLWLSDRYELLPENLSQVLPQELFDKFIDALKSELKSLLAKPLSNEYKNSWQQDKLIYFLKELAEERGLEKEVKYYRELLSQS